MGKSKQTDGNLREYIQISQQLALHVENMASTTTIQLHEFFSCLQPRICSNMKRKSPHMLLQEAKLMAKKEV